MLGEGKSLFCCKQT